MIGCQRECVYYVTLELLEVESDKLRHQLTVHNDDEHHVQSLTLVVSDVVEGSVFCITCVLQRNALVKQTYHFIAGISRPFRAKLRTSRSLATVADPPVRRYGGLKDQDRIFTNAFCRHDHGIKGAMVRTYSIL